MPKKRKKYDSHYEIDKRTGLGYARIQIPTGETDERGRRTYKSIRRRALNQTHAQEIAAEILAEYAAQGKGFLTGREMTFADLAEWYKEEFLTAPVYAGDELVAGMRGWLVEQRRLARLKPKLAHLKLADVTDEVLRSFRLERLKKDNLSISTVNHDLSLIRAMLRRALKKKWIRELPDFEELMLRGEKPRQVTLDETTEKILLETALSKNRFELYCLIIVLHDTGARPSEIYQCGAGSLGVEFDPPTWKRFFEGGGETLELVSFKGRDKEKRIVPVSARMTGALRELFERAADKSMEGLIFPRVSYDKAWRQTKKDAGLSDHPIRLRDLRRSYRTRLEKRGVSQLLAQKLLGHSTAQMSYNYLAIDKEAIDLARTAIDGQSEITSDAVN